MLRGPKSLETSLEAADTSVRATYWVRKKSFPWVYHDAFADIVAGVYDYCVSF